MKSAHCAFEFKQIVSQHTMEEIKKQEVLPAVCEQCGEISLLVHGVMRKITEDELIELNKSSAWKTLLKPAQDIIRRLNKRSVN